MNTLINDLPNEIIFDILSKLSFKDRIICCLVCDKWNILIMNSKFSKVSINLFSIINKYISVKWSSNIYHDHKIHDHSADTLMKYVDAVKNIHKNTCLDYLILLLNQFNECFGMTIYSGTILFSNIMEFVCKNYRYDILKYLESTARDDNDRIRLILLIINASKNDEEMIINNISNLEFIYKIHEKETCLRLHSLFIDYNEVFKFIAMNISYLTNPDVKCSIVSKLLPRNYVLAEWYILHFFSMEISGSISANSLIHECMNSINPKILILFDNKTQYISTVVKNLNNRACKLLIYRLIYLICQINDDEFTSWLLKLLIPFKDQININIHCADCSYLGERLSEKYGCIISNASINGYKTIYQLMKHSFVTPDDMLIHAFCGANPKTEYLDWIMTQFKSRVEYKTVKSVVKKIIKSDLISVEHLLWITTYIYSNQYDLFEIYHSSVKVKRGSIKYKDKISALSTIVYKCL
jgi:hypothetical protein